MPHSLTSMAAPSPRPSLHRFQGPLISHGSCLWLVLGVPGRQPLLQVCPHPALPQPRGCGPAPSSPRPSPAHRWSRTRCAVVCAQALSSRCPASRHLGGWRSHPRSSARTWRHLAKGGRVRAQVPHLPHLTSWEQQHSTWNPQVMGTGQAGTLTSDCHGKGQGASCPVPLLLPNSLPLLMARGLPTPLVFLDSAQGTEVRKLA